MIVIAGDREHAEFWIKIRQRTTEIADIAAHGVGPGEIVAGQENEIGALAVDSLDRFLEARQILFAIDVEVADLTSDESGERPRQLTHGQFQWNHFDAVDSPPPDPMEWAQRDRGFAYVLL